MTELQHGRRFYLARHGETDDNRKGILSGRHNNTHLTKKGIGKAVELQPLLQKLDPPITHATSSSLERAEITEYLATHHMSVPQIPSNPDFDERDYEKDGVTKEGAETYEAHQERVVRGINKLLEDPNSVPLVVCHGGTIRRVMDAIGNFQKAPDYIQIPNASVIEIVTPSSSTAQNWQINVVSLSKDGIERRPVALNAEMYKRKPNEPREYNA